MQVLLRGCSSCWCFKRLSEGVSGVMGERVLSFPWRVSCGFCGQDFSTGQLMEHVSGHDFGDACPVVEVRDRRETHESFGLVQLVAEYSFLLRSGDGEGRCWRYQGRPVVVAGFGVRFASVWDFEPTALAFRHFSDTGKLNIKSLDNGVGIGSADDSGLAWRVEQFFFQCIPDGKAKSLYSEEDVEARVIEAFIGAAAGTCSLGSSFASMTYSAELALDFNNPTFVGGGADCESHGFEFS